jgi:hypothetical protein
MKKIKYSIRMAALSHGIMVEPIIEQSFGHRLNMMMLPLSETVAIKWIWCYSYINTEYIEKSYSLLLKFSQERPAFMRETIRSNTVTVNEQTIYSAIINRLFSSLRCGIDYREMLIKIDGHLSSISWADFNIPALVIESQCQLLYRCKIYPQYGIIASFLQVDELHDLPSVELAQWQPQDASAYEIIWQLGIELSNGERYVMQLPICSALLWYQRIQKYVDDNPKRLTSPAINCAVMTERYDYQIIRKCLEELCNDIVGSSSTEVLLKLSSYLHDAQRKNYLQKILSTGDVELKFSGEVIWEDHRPK